MANTRQYFASGLLKDGRWWVVGGEYSDAGGDTPLGEIFNPTTNTWSKMNKDPNFNWIQGDCISCTMAGKYLLHLQSARDALNKYA